MNFKDNLNLCRYNKINEIKFKFNSERMGYMGNIGYIAKKISKMNLRNFFRVLNELHMKTRKSRRSLASDMMLCAKKFLAGYMDYKMFDMYDLSDDERKIILTSGKNNCYVSKLNPKKYINLFHEKVLFNEHFSSFLGRSWICLTENNYDDFEIFLQGKKKVIVKPLNLCCGQGIEVINTADYTAKELYDFLLKTQRTLVEEIVIQADEMNEIYPYAVNTFRIVTVISNSGKANIVGAYLRVGCGGNVVDNFNHGGIAAPVNIKTGKIEHLFRNKENHYYYNHPDTQFPLYGHVFQRWSEIIQTAEKLAQVIPQMRYVGWDLCLTENDVVVIEANEYPGNDLYQIPKEHIGTCDLIEDAILS